MRKLLLAALALVSTAILSSCALLPYGATSDDDHQQADEQMEKIAAAVNSGDIAALKDLFSTRALEQASDVDAGLEYFLSFFPDGGLTWERDAIGSEGEGDASGGKTEMLRANYKLSVDGKEYWLFFADFTVNDVIDPENVGVYAMGVTPWTEDPRSGPAEPFSDWAGAIHYKGASGKGYPGVYVPE